MQELLDDWLLADSVKHIVFRNNCCESKTNSMVFARSCANSTQWTFIKIHTTNHAPIIFTDFYRSCQAAQSPAELFLKTVEGNSWRKSSTDINFIQPALSANEGICVNYEDHYGFKLRGTLSNFKVISTSFEKYVCSHNVYHNLERKTGVYYLTVFRAN